MPRYSSSTAFFIFQAATTGAGLVSSDLWNRWNKLPAADFLIFPANLTANFIEFLQTVRIKFFPPLTKPANQRVIAGVSRQNTISLAVTGTQIQIVAPLAPGAPFRLPV